MTKICKHCGEECGCGGYHHDTIRVAYLKGEAGEEEKKLIHKFLPTMRGRAIILLAEAEKRRNEHG